MASPLEFAAKMHTFSKALPRAVEAGVMAGAEVVKKTTTAAGPGLMRNVGRKGGVKLTAKIALRKGDNPSAVVSATPPGPWAIREAGSYKKSGGWDIPRKRRRGTTKVLRLPNGFASRVHHPPLGAKHEWSKGVAAGLPLVPRAIDHAVEVTMRGLFRG